MISLAMRLRLLLTVITVLTLGLAPLLGCAPSKPLLVTAAASCLLFDVDGNMDDLRALAVLWPHRRVAAVVSTDGIVSARAGAATIAQFLGGERNVVVIQGRDRLATSAVPAEWTWLAQTRIEAERLANLFASTGPRPLEVIVPGDKALNVAIARAVADCASVGLVITGPWTSFAAYRPAIATKLAFVVAQGRSPTDTTNPGWGVVNCRFDRPACLEAVKELGSTPSFWIDLPARGPTYPITADLIMALSDRALSGKLKRVMQQDNQWQRQQMWDDGAALFLIDPSRFRQVGQHIEPAAAPADLLLLEARAINAGGR